MNTHPTHPAPARDNLDDYVIREVDGVPTAVFADGSYARGWIPAA